MGGLPHHLQATEVEYDEVLVEKYKACFREIEEERQDLPTSFATMDRWFPDRQELKAFQDWTSAVASASIGPRVTAEEFVRQVESTNFFNSRDYDGLLQSMDSMYAIAVPMGFEGHILYRLADNAFTLHAHPRANNILGTSNNLYMRSCFLGVNPTVQPHEPAEPEARRQANLSEISTKSVDNDDAGAPGFVFFQLGELQFTERENDRQGPWNTDDDRILGTPVGWRTSGFVVVVRVGRSGHADGIYAIYNMFEIYDDDDDSSYSGHDYNNNNDDDDDDDDNSRNFGVLITHSRWGIPPIAGLAGREESKDQFSCAKIGPSLSSFGKDYQMVWIDKIEHPVELVRVKRSGNGRIVRATVDEKFWPPPSMREEVP